MNHPRRIYESEIEDYLEERYWDIKATEFWWFIDRQVTLPHGRLDMLFYEDGLLVVELKARSLKARDVCQVLRYQSDIRKLIRNSWQDYHARAAMRADQEFAGESRDKFMEVFGDAFLKTFDYADYPQTCPVLIGADAPEEVVAAMSAVAGRVYTWSVTENGEIDLEQQTVAINPLTKANKRRATAWLERYYGVVHDNAHLEANSIQELLVHKLFGDIAFTSYSRGYDGEEED